MKKFFIEPEIVRIDLKMTENIADSSMPENPIPRDYEYGFRYYVTTSVGNDYMCYDYIFNPTYGYKAPPRPIPTQTAIDAVAMGCYRIT